jgi:SSS family solute:Na+ symporter
LLSYLGWTSAQMTALGLVIYVLSGGALALNQAILIGALVVLVYTIFGGMWSVAFTDLFQTVVIVIGLYARGHAGGRPGGRHAQGDRAGRGRRQVQFFPATHRAGGPWPAPSSRLPSARSAAGRVPAHDQRQGREDRRARHLIGGAAYFVRLRADLHRLRGAGHRPGHGPSCSGEDAREIQRILPDLVLGKMPLWAQVMFFGALLSAILSTASGALLAPTALFTENVLRPFCRT